MAIWASDIAIDPTHAKSDFKKYFTKGGSGGMSPPTKSLHAPGLKHSLKVGSGDLDGLSFSDTDSGKGLSFTRR